MAPKMFPFGKLKQQAGIAWKLTHHRGGKGNIQSTIEARKVKQANRRSWHLPIWREVIVRKRCVSVS